MIINCKYLPFSQVLNRPYYSYLMLNMSHFTKTLNSNNIGHLFVPVEKVPRLP